MKSKASFQTKNTLLTTGFVLCLLSLLFGGNLFGQTSVLDSFALLESSQYKRLDTARVMFLTEYASVMNESNPQRALEIAHEALNLGLTLQFVPGIAKSHRTKGVIFYYRDQYDKATEQYLAALRMYEELGDKESMSMMYNNLGIIHWRQKNWEGAQSFFSQAIDIMRQFDNPQRLSAMMLNLGTCYDNLGQIDKALAIYDSAYQLKVILNDKVGMANVLNNIGYVHQSRDKHALALDYYQKALALYDLEASTYNRISALTNVGACLSELGQWGQAEVLLREAELLADSLEAPNQALEVFRAQLDLRAKQTRDPRLVELWSKVRALEDSLNKVEMQTEVEKLNRIYNYESQEIENEALKREQELQHAVIRSQRIINFAALSLVLVAIIFVIFLAGANRRKKAMNAQLRQNNAQILEQRDEIQAQQSAISKQNKELAELNATKDRFFSIIAHDLKNPFNSMMGFSQLLHQHWDRLDEAKRRKNVETLYNSSRKGYELLENLLEWSRAQTGKITSKPSRLVVESVVRQSQEVIRANALRKQIELSAHLGPGLEVFADEKMLDTVLRNLQTNAIKFTPQGGRVAVFAEADGEMAHFQVVDTGLGIVKESLEKLFRIDHSHSTVGTENESGTGLGLILCKEFVEMNGGRIWAESEGRDKGSSFHFTLPLHQREAKPVGEG